VQIYDVEGFREQLLNELPKEVKVITEEGNLSSLRYLEIPSTEGLYIAMDIEHKGFSDASRFLIFIVLIGGTFACIFIFIFVNKIATFVTKPLTRMVEIIRDSHGTNFIEIPEDLKQSKDEIGILANTIDEMAKNIRNNVNMLNTEIKEREKAEENLMVLNDELECRVEQRTVELKTAKEQAEEANSSKSQFLANMSHEIRTPMNAIMGLTHLISQSTLNDHQKNYVSKIQGASSTLLRIINDILDFSKIEAGKIEIENIKFNLNKVIENISNLYAISATNKGIDINFDTGESVPDILIGDPLRLEQIICNLTTNAIKFTKLGEVNVAVRVESETEKNVKLHFSVTDTGIGLTKDQTKKLFTAFGQADSSMTRKYGGTGLGLAISKQLVELMNGQIWVESEYGEGASFQFTVEFDKIINELKTNYFEYPELKGKRVLVVDHNKTSLTILKRMLSSFSLDVTTAGSSYDAISIFENENFDLLIIDFNLPELSGIDLYKRLVANKSTKLPKTIFVSATGRESYYNQVNQVGVINFLVKPINQSLMFDTVINALKGTVTERASKNDNEADQLKYQTLLSDKNILVVEDNEINQLVARDILAGAGIRVSIASNGEEAIKHIRANKFHAVLMDVQMPIMDGYEATEIIRKTYSSTDLPIIAMTANALKGDRERSINSGMNDYISKPINPQILFETLIKWLNGKSINPIESQTIEITNNENEILDIEKTLVRLGNKKDFYVDLLKRYEKSYSNITKELLELMENKKRDETKRFIHSLKSVTANIGAIKLNNFLVILEEKYESFEEEVLKENIETLSYLNVELLKSIQKFVSMNDLKEKISPDSIYIYIALEKFHVALCAAHAKEIKECMNKLEIYCDDIGITNQITQVKKLVERYRFKDAKLILEQLMEVLREDNNG
jgi:two-component system sensor histidine kinase/response regulator